MIELLWAVIAVIKLACIWQLWQVRAGFNQIGLRGAMAGAAQQSSWEGRRNTVFDLLPAAYHLLPAAYRLLPSLFRSLADGLRAWHSPPKMGSKPPSSVDYSKSKG